MDLSLCFVFAFAKLPDSDTYVCASWVKHRWLNFSVNREKRHSEGIALLTCFGHLPQDEAGESCLQSVYSPCSGN